jgi:two-component system alkaline phosphatase synthesis response regulator PhoP
MSSREFQLLRYFIENPERVITREELLEKVWGYRGAVFTRTVDVHVGLLRKKLDNQLTKPAHFLTERGSGYRFRP